MSAANGRLARIKSTLYGNVELRGRRLLLSIINVGRSTLMRILLASSLKPPILGVLPCYHELF